MFEPAGYSKTMIAIVLIIKSKVNFISYKHQDTENILKTTSQKSHVKETFRHRSETSSI